MKKITTEIKSILVIIFSLFIHALSFAKNSETEQHIIHFKFQNVHNIFISNEFSESDKSPTWAIVLPKNITNLKVRLASKNIFNYLSDYTSPEISIKNDNLPCPDEQETESEWTNPTKAMWINSQKLENQKVKLKPFEKKNRFNEQQEIYVFNTEDKIKWEAWLKKNKLEIEYLKPILETHIKNDVSIIIIKNKSIRYFPDSPILSHPIKISYNSYEFDTPLVLEGDYEIKSKNRLSNPVRKKLQLYLLTETGTVTSRENRMITLPTDKYLPQFIINQFDEFYQDLTSLTYMGYQYSVYLLECATSFDATISANEDSISIEDKQILLNDLDWKNNFPNQIHVTRLQRVLPLHHSENNAWNLHWFAIPKLENFRIAYEHISLPQANFDCPEGRKLIRTHDELRKKELENYYSLTGKGKNSSNTKIKVIPKQ